MEETITQNNAYWYWYWSEDQTPEADYPVEYAADYAGFPTNHLVQSTTREGREEEVVRSNCDSLSSPVSIAAAIPTPAQTTLQRHQIVVEKEGRQTKTPVPISCIT